MEPRGAQVILQFICLPALSGYLAFVLIKSIPGLHVNLFHLYCKKGNNITTHTLAVPNTDQLFPAGQSESVPSVLVAVVAAAKKQHQDGLKA